MSRLRRTEILILLATATELGMGQPAGHSLRRCALALEMARRLGMSAVEQQEVYLLGLLRWVGCTGHASELARLLGDEITARADMSILDPTEPVTLIGFMYAHSAGGGPLARAFRLPGNLIEAAGELRRGAAATCEVGRDLARRLNLGEVVERDLQ